MDSLGGIPNSVLETPIHPSQTLLSFGTQNMVELSFVHYAVGFLSQHRLAGFGVLHAGPSAILPPLDFETRCGYLSEAWELPEFVQVACCHWIQGGYCRGVQR